MLASLDDIGIKGLGFMEYGMRNITNSKLPIEKPEDLPGHQDPHHGKPDPYGSLQRHGR